jgi:hypothetical protein
MSGSIPYGVEARMRKRTHDLILAVPGGLGFGFGVYFVLTSPYRESSLWPVWAPLVIAFTTAAGVVFRYGLRRWPEVARHRQIGIPGVMWRVVVVLVLALLVLIGSTVVPVGTSWRQVMLLSVLFLGGTPAAVVMEAVRRTADVGFEVSARGQQVVALLQLRQLLQRLLAAIGSLVALSTLAVGASLTIERSLPGADALPSQFVLIFGGMGSLLVALFYLPAAAALQRRGLWLSDELFPLRETDNASVILSRAEDRHKLEGLLGADRGVFADFQTGLAILGPLLASAVAAFLDPR